MKTSDQVTADKLRGGFYSPQGLVDVCLDRVEALLAGRDNVRLLEPSAGDGGFIRGLSRHALGDRVTHVTAVELIAAEASKAMECLTASKLNGAVRTESVLGPSALTEPHDVAVGNPPFVRFQFVSERDRRNIAQLGDRMGVAFRGVSNLWIPVFLAALNNLSDGGVFAFIVPAECFTGLSGRAVRAWLTEHATQLRVDLFPPRSFPGVLQEVVVLSGQVTRGAAHGAKVLVDDHGIGDSWRHVLDDDSRTWTGLLLRPEHLDALSAAQANDSVHRFSDVAKLSVSTVTGANDFFCVTDEVRDNYQLEQWTRPLIDRVRHVPGLDYTEPDHLANRADGRTVWLIDSSLNPEMTDGAHRYITEGENRELHLRYKTRIRSPWWRVPVVSPGSLMLSKRCNHYPRLMRNLASVATTDTVYQGSPLPPFQSRSHDIVASFHNSMTLLTAEMHGRSFGGGVLELVPSEIASLALPLAPTTQKDLNRLDRLVRECGSDNDMLVEQTDALVSERLELDHDMWRLIADARRILRDRRLARH